MADRWLQNYDPRTFGAGTLNYLNGKLYSNGFELRPFDIVNRGAIYDDIGNVVGDDTQAVWEAQDIGGLLGLDKTYKVGQAPILPSQIDRRQVVANPNYVSGNAYQFTPEERLAWFASDPTRRSMLYGNYIETDMGPSNGNPQIGRIRVNDDTGYDIGTYGGEKFVQSEGRGMRGQYATLNSDYVLSALKNIYADKTDAEIDAAAWSAMNDPSRGERARQAWYYAGNPNDVIRAIGAKLGGLPTAAEEALRLTDDQLATRGNSYRTAAHAADDAATMAKTLKRIGGVAGVIGLATGGGLLKDALGSLSNVLGSGASGSSSSLSGLLSGLGDTTADIIAGNAAAGAGAGSTGLDSLIGAIQSGGNTVTPGFGAITGGSSGAGYVGNLVGAGLPVDVGTGLLTGGAGSVLPNVTIPNTTVPEPPTTTPTTPSTPPTQTPTTPTETPTTPTTPPAPPAPPQPVYIPPQTPTVPTTGLDSLINAIQSGGNTVTPGFGSITGGSAGADYVGGLLGSGLPVDATTGLITGGAGSVIPGITVPNTTVPELPTTTPSTPPTQTPTTPTETPATSDYDALKEAANNNGWSDSASPGTSAGPNFDINGSPWWNQLYEGLLNIDPTKLLNSLNSASSLLGGGQQQQQQQQSPQSFGGGFNMKINPYQLGLLNLQQPAYQNIFGE